MCDVAVVKRRIPSQRSNLERAEGGEYTFQSCSDKLTTGYHISEQTNFFDQCLNLLSLIINQYHHLVAWNVAYVGTLGFSLAIAS